MEEILTGVHHWSKRHPDTGGQAHGHYHQPTGTVFDPLVPDEGLEWFEARGVQRVVMSCRHHRRDVEAFAERFGVPVLAHEDGVSDLDGLSIDVTPYATGDELTDGIRVVAMNAIAPDDAAIHIAAGEGALLFADSIINSDGPGFVPDSLIGDDPEGVKKLTRERAAELVASERFDSLLFAHGDPIASGGREALEHFAAQQRGQAL